MAIQIIKILLFLLTNAAGYFAISILVNGLAMLDLMPHMPNREMRLLFNSWLISGGLYAWMGAGVFSVGYFFVRDDELKTWLILAPLYVPVAYALGVMVYFNFFMAVG